LQAVNWEAVKAVVSDDCIFMDMPLGPTIAARGILSDIAQHCGITKVSADQVIPAATYFACH
jgi:hypothetical protein